MRKELTYAWFSFLGSYLVLIAIDYILRSSAENIKVGGIDFVVFWSVWIPFLAFSLYWLFCASKKLRTKFIAIFFMLANLLVAAFIILTLSLFYTVGLGIDSL